MKQSENESSRKRKIIRSAIKQIEERVKNKAEPIPLRHLIRLMQIDPGVEQGRAAQTVTYHWDDQNNIEAATPPKPTPPKRMLM